MTYQARDLSISLRAVSSSQHVLNGGPDNSTFPGWFLTVQSNEGYDTVLGPSQLTVDEVIVIADVIDRTHDNGLKDPLWRTVNAVKTCDKAMRDELVRQLEAAERAAAKIPQLRAMLGREDV